MYQNCLLVASDILNAALGQVEWPLVQDILHVAAIKVLIPALLSVRQLSCNALCLSGRRNFWLALHVFLAVL